MMQYEYTFACPEDIDACFATEFDECVGFVKADAETSASLAIAAEGDELLLTDEDGTLCPYICQIVQTSGYKCFTKKHLFRPPFCAVIARPLGNTDVVLKFMGRNALKRTWRLLAEDKDGKKKLFTFDDKDKINDVRVCVRNKFTRGTFYPFDIQKLAGVHGRRNALQFFSPGAAVGDKKKVQPLKRPSARKKISQRTKK